MSETHTAPSRVTDRVSQFETIESKSPSRMQPTDRFDSPRISVHTTMHKPTDSSGTPYASIDITVRNKQVSSSVDSDLSGSPPPIYQSTPKSNKQKRDDDGHESEDELSDPTTNKQEYQQDPRRRSSKTRLRDFSQSTSHIVDVGYAGQRTKPSFDEGHMENILSHVPTSKGS